MKRFRAGMTALLLSLALTPAATVWAQGQQIQPNYRNADIRQVIEAVGAVTGRNFIIDPRVRAQVTLLSFSPMDADTFYQAFLSMLQVHGYVAVPAGPVTKIIPDATARQMPGSGPNARGDAMVTQTIRLKNVAAAQLVPILRPLMPNYAHLAAHPQSNVLIISDRADNVQRMLSIVQRIDQAGQSDIDVIPLQNASATEVVQILSSLSQSAQGAGGPPTIRAIADPRTNSILLSGSKEERLRYSAYVAHLDTPVKRGGDTQVRYLRYADAKDLATKLQAQFGASGASTAATAGAKGAAPATAGANSGPISIWADQGTNALVISAPAPIMQNIMAVIDKIDIRRAQVQVDAIIVEISNDKLAQLGVTWASDGSAHNGGVGLTNFGSTVAGILQLGTASASGAAGNVSSLPEGISIAGGHVTDTGTSWAALLSALHNDSGTNIVSTQTIVTMDNEEAEINVGEEVPFVTGQYTNTGASSGAINPFQTIQRKQVGTRLKITPQINEGNGVKLTIDQENSSISSSAQGAVDLVTNDRTITTSVFVDSGDVLVLGGLVDDQLLQGEQRVPVLGRIPGLGWLFRARKAQRKKTNLMVFIRPTVLRDAKAARFQTNQKYDYFQSLQEEQSKKPVYLMHKEGFPKLPEVLKQMPKPGEGSKATDQSGATGDAKRGTAPQPNGSSAPARQNGPAQGQQDSSDGHEP
jgi:general secretion pathway protein D